MTHSKKISKLISRKGAALIKLSFIILPNAGRRSAPAPPEQQ